MFTVPSFKYYWYIGAGTGSGTTYLLLLLLLLLFERVNLYTSYSKRTHSKIPHSPLRVLRARKKTLITRFLFFSRFPRHATLVTIKSTHAHGKTSFLNDDDDDDITLTDDDDDVITCENAPPPP